MLISTGSGQKYKSIVAKARGVFLTKGTPTQMMIEGLRSTLALEAREMAPVALLLNHQGPANRVSHDPTT